MPTRQNIDTVICWTFQGAQSAPIMKPVDLLVHALTSYLDASKVKGTATLAPEPTEPTFGPMLPSATPLLSVDEYADAAKLVSLLGDAAAAFMNHEHVVALLKVVFPQAKMDFVWRDREFHFTRSEMMNRAASIGTLGRYSPALRNLLVDAVIAALVEAGVAKWPSNLVCTRYNASLVISARDIPYAALEGAVSAFKFKPCVMPPGPRVMFAPVYEAVRDAMTDFGVFLTDCLQSVYVAGRIGDIVAGIVTRNEAIVAQSAFLPLICSANFVATGAPPTVPTETEVLVLSPHVRRVMDALQANKYVKIRSAAEYASCFTIERILSARTRSAVITVVTRNYDAGDPHVRFLHHNELISSPRLDSVRQLRADGSLIDALVDRISAFVQGPSSAAIMSCLPDAAPLRWLMSTAPLADLRALAVTLSNEMTYVTPSLNPDAPTDYSFVFRPDTSLSGWEDIVDSSIDGVATASAWEDVLRTVSTQQATSPYPLGRGLAPVLSNDETVAVVGGVGPTIWKNAAEELPLAISYAVYRYSPSQGITVEKVLTASPSVSINEMGGLAPTTHSAMAIDPIVRMRLQDGTRLLSALHAIAHSEEPKNVFLYRGRGLPLEGPPPALFPRTASEPHGAADIADQHIANSLLSIVTSEPIKIAYAAAVRKLRARLHDPRTIDEADAYIDSTRAILLRIVSTLLGDDDGLKAVMTSVYGSSFWKTAARVFLLSGSKEAK